MSTSDEYVNLVLKRFLSQNRMEANFRAFLETLIKDGLSRIFPASGLFTFPVGATPAAGQVDLDTDPVEGIDNAGNDIVLSGASRTTNIDYGNDTVSTYNVGMKYMEIVSGVYNNPRTGLPEYDKIKQEVGEKANPTSVTDLGGTIQFNVNSIFQSGQDNAGRQVIVYLVNPQSGDPAVAIETLTVTYSAPNNLVTSAGVFGQGSVSTLAADYIVAAPGVTITTAALGSEYIILGTIDDTGPSFDNSNQTDLSGGGGHTLEKAYDGLSGSGSGRTVTIDSNAIQLRQTTAPASDRSEDLANMALRIRKDLTTTTYPTAFVGDGGIDLPMLFGSYASLLARVGLWDANGNDELRLEETNVSVNGATITLGRSGVDLTFASEVPNYLTIQNDLDLIEIFDSSLGNNGLYLIDAVPTSTTITAKELSGIAASFTTESSLKARLYRPIFRGGPNYTGHALFITALTDWWRKLGVGVDQSVIGIQVPSTTADDTRIYAQDRPSTGGSIIFRADGQITNNNDITSTGDITGANLYADVDVSADNDVIAANDLVATTGNAIIGGKVDAVGNIEGLEHKYTPSKIFWHTLLPEDMMPEDSGFVFVTGNLEDEGGVRYSYWVANAANDRLLVPLHIPIGAEIKEWQLIVNATTTPGSFDAELVYTSHTWDVIGGTPTLNNRTRIGSTQSPSATGLKNIGETSLTHTVVESRGYAIAIKSDANNSTVYTARVQYTISNIKPHA